MPKGSIARAITPLKMSLVILCFFASQVGAKEYVVKLKQKIDEYDLRKVSIATKSALNVRDINEEINAIKVNVDSSVKSADPEGMLSDYFDAEYVVENTKLYAFHSSNEPNDPRRDEQWSLETIHALGAWGVSWGSEQVVVAVIDTGVDTSHEDLVENLWVNSKEVAGNGKDDDNNGYVDDINGWDFHASDKDPMDETSSANPGHGTHCAGVIGAACGNDRGICGISPTVSLMALRFLGSDGSGDLFSATKAIDYAAKNGAHVISASWGAAMPEAQSQPIIDAIKKAEEKGVIFVAAAGNEGRSNDTTAIFPANAGTPNMISVTASDNNDIKPSWANYGRKVDIASPGKDILSTIPGGYDKLSGTSMAAPLVAGLVALMKSVDSSLTGAQARSILQSTGESVAIETASNRRILADKALEAVQTKQLTLVPAAKTLIPGESFDFSAWGGAGGYKFKSSNPSVATITEAGRFVAVAEGDVVIEVTDANNVTASSVSIKVANAPPAGSSCPIQNELICLIMCAINPEFPWCGDTPGLPIPTPPVP